MRQWKQEAQGNPEGGTHVEGVPVETDLASPSQKPKAETNTHRDRHLLQNCEADLASPSQAKQFTSFSQAASFYDEFLDEVLTREPEGGSVGFDSETCTLPDLAEWLRAATHSSAFSGIAAPETALLGLHRAVQARMPDQKARFRNQYRKKTPTKQNRYAG